MTGKNLELFLMFYTLIIENLYIDIKNIYPPYIRKYNPMCEKQIILSVILIKEG